MRRVLAALALVLLMLAPASPATAWDPFGAFKDSGCPSKSVVCEANGEDPISGTDGILRKVTNFIALLAGIVSVILVMISGFQFITSNGDSNKVASARNALIGAIVGVVIVVAAQSILVFVLKGA